MHAKIQPIPADTAGGTEATPAPFRTPHYECREQPQALKVRAYIPGVDAAGVEITSQGPDLQIVGRKSHFVRVNWQSLHLERAQQDYRLRLRLGEGFAYEQLRAVLREGFLEVHIPKRQLASAANRQRRVA